jgi:murein DD-endopeptidase MepM/ murein hydrolase activator NlpD
VATAVIAAVVVVGAVAGARACSQARAKKPKKVVTAALPTVRYFARIQGTSIKLALPASLPELVAVGFHQAENPRSRNLTPIIDWLSDDDTAQAVKLVRSETGREIVMFQQRSRGRGTGQQTAADIAVKEGTLITSPVTGEVTMVKRYRLYGRYDDLHVEIRPDGHDDLRVVGIHMQDLMVEEGDRVEAGRTTLGRTKRFPFEYQIDRYIGYRVPHTHFQVNPYPPVS